MSNRRPGTTLAVTLVTATLLHLAPPGRAQAPRFQSGVDMVLVDVNVLGGGGNPIATLTKPDFVLKIDGKPREIASVSMQDYRIAPPAPGAAPTPSSGGAMAGPPRAPDRTFLLLVDRTTISHGDWRKTVDGAKSFVDGLPVSDAVGVAMLPSSSLAIRFDQPRATVKQQLDSILKSAYGWSDRSAGAVQAEFQLRDLLDDIGAVVKGLSQVPGPKHLVLVGAPVLSMPDRSIDLSRGRTIGDTNQAPSEASAVAGTEATARRREADRQVADTRRAGTTVASMAAIAEAAGLARLRIHTLTLGDSSDWSSPQDRASHNAEGLSVQSRTAALESNNLASATGGVAMFPVKGDTFFNRLSRELSVSYAISFLPQPGDDDGRPHRIEVSVPNAGKVQVRARDEFVIPSGALKTTR